MAATHRAGIPRQPRAAGPPCRHFRDQAGQDRPLSLAGGRRSPRGADAGPSGEDPRPPASSPSSAGPTLAVVLGTDPNLRRVPGQASFRAGRGRRPTVVVRVLEHRVPGVPATDVVARTSGAPLLQPGPGTPELVLRHPASGALRCSPAACLRVQALQHDALADRGARIAFQATRSGLVWCCRKLAGDPSRCRPVRARAEGVDARRGRPGPGYLDRRQAGAACDRADDPLRGPGSLPQRSGRFDPQDQREHGTLAWLAPRALEQCVAAAYPISAYRRSARH